MLSQFPEELFDRMLFWMVAVPEMPPTPPGPPLRLVLFPPRVVLLIVTLLPKAL